MEKKTEIIVPSIRVKNKDGYETSYSIKEIENGFIVTVNCSGKNKKGEHEYTTKEYFVTTNPIAKESENIYEIMENAIEAANPLS